MHELTNVLEIKRNGRTYTQITNTIDDLRKKRPLSIIKKGIVFSVLDGGSSAEYFKNEKIFLSFDKKIILYLLDLSKTILNIYS